jgi:uroporphyrinogen decarboxylase
MTSKEVVTRTIKFQGADRFPIDFPEKYGNDFMYVDMTPSPDARPHNQRDEWGALWENIGVCNLGEVKDFPLKDWSDYDKLTIPDIKDPKRWKDIDTVRERAGEKFILGFGISLYERIHFVRGLENTWTDIYESPQQLGKLIDILVDMNCYAIEKYANAGVDGYLFADDWGLQDKLMISPKKWQEIWKPKYTKVFKAAHDAGLLMFLHSCGYIVDILDDLIEIGLDVIQMDQQENMGLELLGERFGGRITFYNPVDIQNTMVYGTMENIRAYCRKMVKLLGTPNGGFIPKWYSDPVGAGHRQEAIDVMCDEFLKINSNIKNFY